MAMDAVEIERLIKEALPGAVVIIEDLRQTNELWLPAYMGAD